VALLQDRERRDALARSAEAFVRRHHQWEVHLTRMERILEDVARAHRTSPVGLLAPGA
jgi:hypothetical protein